MVAVAVACLIAVVAALTNNSPSDLAVATTLDPVDATSLTATTVSPTIPVNSPTLAELVPDLGAELVRLAYMDDAGRLGVAEWAGISPNPTTLQWVSGYVHPFAPHVPHQWVDFAPHRRTFAYTDGRGALMVEIHSIAAGVSGFAWHPEIPDLAWVAQVPGSHDRALFRLPAESRSIADITEVAHLGSEEGRIIWYLTGWGDWGYALTGNIPHLVGAQDVTVLLDAAGNARHLIAATARMTAADGTLVIESSVVAPEVGDLVAELFPGADMTELAEGWWLRTPDGSTHQIDFPASFAGDVVTTAGYVLGIETSLGRTDVIVTSPTSDWETDVRPADVEGSFIGQSRGHRWLVFSTENSIELLDWRNGDVRTLPFDLGRAIAISF